MLEIPVPEESFAEFQLLLAGIEYRFVYKFNTRDDRWYIDIFIDEDPVILGVKVMENQSLLDRYHLPDFDHGDLRCLRLGSSLAPVGRDNLGIGKNYDLVYFSNEELAT